MQPKDDPDVLHLRGKALLYKLNARELARILYAFAGRRGYIDHGKGTTDVTQVRLKRLCRKTVRFWMKTAMRRLPRIF